MQRANAWKILEEFQQFSSNNQKKLNTVILFCSFVTFLYAIKCRVAARRTQLYACVLQGDNRAVHTLPSIAPVNYDAAFVSGFSR